MTPPPVENPAPPETPIQAANPEEELDTSDNAEKPVEGSGTFEPEPINAGRLSGDVSNTTPPSPPALSTVAGGSLPDEPSTPVNGSPAPERAAAARPPISARTRSQQKEQNIDERDKLLWTYDTGNYLLRKLDGFGGKELVDAFRAYENSFPLQSTKVRLAVVSSITNSNSFDPETLQ